MKKLYLIGGTMGVGKTTVSRILADMLPNCVFLDGDWCWDAHPFVVNDETKQMVMENICFMLGNFMRCRTYENVVFCWVMDMQDTIDAILSSLPWDDYEIVNISLVCDSRELKKRLYHDVDRGLREESVVGRSLNKLALYQALNTTKLDVTSLDPKKAASLIAEM